MHWNDAWNFLVTALTPNERRSRSMLEEEAGVENKIKRMSFRRTNEEPRETFKMDY